MDQQNQQIILLEKRIETLEQALSMLAQKRVAQDDVIPFSIKQRHMGEGNKFFRSGLAASRPTSGKSSPGSVECYFATDTRVLSIWDGTTWRTSTLT